MQSNEEGGLSKAHLEWAIKKNPENEQFFRKNQDNYSDRIINTIHRNIQEDYKKEGGVILTYNDKDSYQKNCLVGPHGGFQAWLPYVEKLEKEEMLLGEKEPNKPIQLRLETLNLRSKTEMNETISTSEKNEKLCKAISKDKDPLTQLVEFLKFREPDDVGRIVLILRKPVALSAMVLENILELISKYNKIHTLDLALTECDAVNDEILTQLEKVIEKLPKLEVLCFKFSDCKNMKDDKFAKFAQKLLFDDKLNSCDIFLSRSKPEPSFGTNSLQYVKKRTIQP